MSDNESKLVFDTLIGSDTLTKALEKQLGITKQIKDNLKDIKKNSDKVKTPLDKAGVTLVDVSSLKTGIQLLNAMVHGKDALAKMSSVFNTKDITTVEGIVGAMSKLLSLTEKYSQFSNKKLQLVAFDGSLTEKQFNANKKNIDALKAMNKGFAQSGDTSSKFAKEGIRLVEEHNKKLKEQGRIERENASQKVKESKDTRATLKRKAFEGSLTRTDIDKAKTPQGLKAIQAGLVNRQHLPNLTAAERKAIEGLERSVQTKLTKLGVTPFETQSQHKFTKLSDFETSGLTKGESKVGLSLLARRIATMKKEGATYAQVVKQEELLQAARDLHAKNFRPASAFQLREAENLRVAKLPQNMPLANLSSLTSRDEVARQLRMSSIRSKDMSEGPAKQAEILYADALKAHGLTLEKAQKIVEANSRKEADAVAKQRMAEAQERAKIREAEAKAAQKVQQLADRASRKVLERQRQLDDESPSSVLRRAKQHGVNAEISKTDSGYAVKVRQAQEAGALTVVRQERKQRNDRELEHLSLTRYQRMSDLAGLDAAELKQAKRVLNYRNGMATAGGRVEKLNIEMLQELSKQQAALAKKTRADEKLATHNQRMANDPTYAAAQNLKINQEQLVRKSYDDRRQAQILADLRLQTKADNDRINEQARQRGTYQTEAAIRALKTPRQVEDARAALNYQKGVGNTTEVAQAKDLLQLLKEVHGVKKAQAKVRADQLLTHREEARTGKITSANILGETNKDVLRAYGQGFKKASFDNTNPALQASAKTLRAEVEAELKYLSQSAKRKSEMRPYEVGTESPTAYLSRARKHGANEEISKTDLGFRTKVTEAQQAGALAVERQARKNKRDQELETLAKTQYLTLSSLQGLSHAEMVQASRILNYRKNMAGVTGKADTININLLDELSKQKTALKKQTRAIEKEAEHQRRLASDPDYAAKYHLKTQSDALITNSLQDRMQGQRVSDARLRTKADNDRINEEARRNGTYATEASLRALTTPRQVEDARAALNYQKGVGTAAEVAHAKDMLQLLKEIHGKKKAIAGTDNLIAQLEKTHYQTKASLNGLGREELQQAIAVLTYRRQIATTEQQRAAAQGLLNTANQAYKINPEHQADNREAARTRILGDAGASVLTIQAGLMLNYKLLAGIQGLFGNALSSVIELDSAFRQLQAISASTNTEMVSMKQNLILVAQASKFSASEVGQTAVLLAQAGFSVGEISQSMKGVIALAQATGTELGKSVDVVTSVLSVFNKGAGETDQVVNQLTEALNRSKLDINKMALGIQYAGNIAADSGITFEELTASLGAMANAGIRSGSTLGTGLRQMFIDLQKPSEKLKAKLQGLGLSLDQVDLKSYGLIGVLENLKNAGFTTGDAFKTFEVRAASAFAALSGNMDDFNQLKEGLNDTTAAFDANGVQLEALAVQLDHLKSNLGILSAEALMPVAALVRDLAKATAHAMEKTEEGSGTLQKFGTVLTGLTTTVAVGWFAALVFNLGAIGVNALKAAAAFVALRAGFLGLAASLSAGLTTTLTWGAMLTTVAPVLIGIAAGVGVVVASFSAWDRETDKLNDKLDKAKAAFNKNKEAVATAKTAYDNAGEAISRLSEKYGVLNESQVATTDEAQSLITKFGDMGFAIENVANVKISQLMQKLQELRKELGEKYSIEVSDAHGTKVALINAEDELARKNLRATEFSPAAMAQTALGLRGKSQTGGFGQRLYGKLNKTPEISMALADLTEKMQSISKEGGLPEGFNFGAEKSNIMKLLNKKGIDTYTTEEVRKYLEDKLGASFRDYQTRRDSPKKRTRADDAYDSESYAIRASEAATESGTASYEAKQAQLGYGVIQAQINNEKGASADAKVLQKGKFAAVANKAVQREIEVYDALITSSRKRLKAFEDADQGGSDEAKGLARQIKGWEDQRSEIQADNKQINEAIEAAEALSSKGKLQDLERQKWALEEEYKDLKRASDSETGTLKQSTKAQLAFNKQKEIQAVELEITKLSAKKDADLPYQLEQKHRGHTAELKTLTREQQERQKALKIAVSKRVVSIQSETENTRLEKYKQDQIDWVDANNLSDELFDKAQSAARKRAALQSKKVLNAGNMFKDINKDLAKAAQDAANATGQAQEYSSYGTGIGGFFARQAANAKNGVNEGKLKQEKLAREFLQLKASDDHYNALKLEETIPKAQKELAAKNVELEAINTKLKDSNLSEAEAVADQKALIVEEIKAIEARLKTEQDLLKTSKEDRARHLATIEELKADLASMQDKTNVFKDSFDAGRQALDAGLSAGFQDWATQTIKNIDDVEAAFKSMGLSILQSMLKVVSDRTAMAFTNMLLGKADGSTGLGLIGSLGSAFFSNASSAAAGAAGIGNGAISLGMSSGGFVNGNAIPHFANGGATAGTDIGRDSIPAYLRPDEYVLRPSATAALGKPFLDRLNATTTGSLKQLEGKAAAPQINVVQSPPTNVFVVSPDQKAQMGPNDVVVSVEDNISRGGSIKRLIKQVISGEV